MADKKAKQLEITFKKAIQELEKILADISAPETSLDESIAQYARAAELIKICHETLEKASIKVEEINAGLRQLEESDES